MSAASARQASSAAGSLRWLADAYARYAHLVLAQLQALDDGDVSLVESLAVERDALALAIDEADPVTTLDAPGAERTLAEVRMALARAAEADAKLRNRIGQLRAETRAEIGRTDDAAGRVAGIARTYAPPAPPGGRLDVSL